jgi:hypothetical protein
VEMPSRKIFRIINQYHNNKIESKTTELEKVETMFQDKKGLNPEIPNQQPNPEQ